MRGETKDFIKIAGIIIGLGVLILGILTSDTSDSIKYFAISILFHVLIIVYIQIVVVHRIEKIEELVKIKEME